MEKESITITIEASIIGQYTKLHDKRQITVQSTRGEVAKKLDEICADIEANFES